MTHEPRKTAINREDMKITKKHEEEQGSLPRRFEANMFRRCLGRPAARWLCRNRVEFDLLRETDQPPNRVRSFFNCWFSS
jgi:hypothetical protein